jgi:hypothetical protein
LALTEVAPLSPPMIKVTYIGFVVPVKLAPVADAWNVYRKVPVSLISAFRFTPLITPREVERPGFVLREGAGRDGGGEGANLERDWFGKRMDAGGAAQGEVGIKVKGGSAVEVDREGGAEGEEGDGIRKLPVKDQLRSA